MLNAGSEFVQKNEQPTPDILTFGIVSVQDTRRCSSVFVSEPRVSSRRKNELLDVTKRTHRTGRMGSGDSTG